ncbi:MAG: hypothetical protein JWN04_1466 [Myxococcaceae bacterium]|nr:hypothetical protein [Myxococcaceae bacterium]
MTLSKPIRRALCSLTLLGAVHAGCGDDDKTVATDSGTRRADAAVDASRPANDFDAGDASATSLVDAATALTDNQIIGVASALNMGEINAGMLALTKASGASARDYANMMVTMHTAAQTRQTALGIAPATSPQQQSVMTMASTALQNLQNLPAGPNFDVAYLESQVMMHQSALALIDTVLLPSATTSALRDELTRTRGEVTTHLSEAQALLSSDGGVRADAGTTATISRLDGGT